MIFQQLTDQLRNLENLLQNLTNDQYTKNVKHLGNSSIGGHSRHIIELILCALKGHRTGCIDYINRERNLLLENDKDIAITALQQLIDQILLSDCQLMLATEEGSNHTNQLVTTTYFREIVYNTEHTIHHLALIKVALIEMNLDLVEVSFGMAYSTLKYQNQ